MKDKKLTNRDLSISTKRSKAYKGRVESIPIEEARLLKKVIDEVLTQKDFIEMKKVTYWFKHDILERNFKSILDALETYPEGSKIADKMIVNKKPYFTHIIVTSANFHRPLTWKQKFVVLTEMYKIYNYKGEELDTLENKRYRSPEVFIKVLDEGKIDEWSVSVSGYCDTAMHLLEHVVNISDIIFWLQNEWRGMSGDYFIKKNSNVLSRKTNIFTDRHYSAFNTVFNKVFGRDLKCVGKFTNDNVEGIIGRIKAGLEGENNE